MISDESESQGRWCLEGSRSGDVHFCFPLPSLFSSSGSFVSNGGHSSDGRGRKTEASRLISAASRVSFSPSAQDLVLEAGAAKAGFSEPEHSSFTDGTLQSGGGRLCSPC